MPFHTRDFEELFDIEYTTAQFMVSKGYISISGPPPKGRGGRRRYDLEAAFRVGLTSRLRTLGATLEQCHQRTQFVAQYFLSLPHKAPAGMNELQKLYFSHNPFLTPIPPLDIDFFYEFYDTITPGTGKGKTAVRPQHLTWEAIHSNSPTRGQLFFPTEYCCTSAPDRPTVSTPPPAQIQFADLHQRINLTSISRQLKAFIERHERQFPEYPDLTSTRQ